jgi:folate-binding protein YgfZ
LRERATAANLAAAELARLRDAIPAMPGDIGPRDLPNEGGLEEIAISYTKGCYLGQEVMARLKNLGQVRRRLHLVRGAGVAPVPPGTALYQGERKVGETRSVAAEGDGFVAMAMLSLVNLDPEAALALSPEGRADIRILQRV